MAASSPMQVASEGSRKSLLIVLLCENHPSGHRHSWATVGTPPQPQASFSVALMMPRHRDLCLGTAVPAELGEGGW